MAGRPIWVHACSVGEVSTARPLLLGIRARFSGVPVLLTTSTSTGQVFARRTCREHADIAWLPFDTRRAVCRFLIQTKPKVLVLVETELWPNLLREADRQHIPVVIVNGRLSDKHLARYRRFGRFFRRMTPHLRALGVQSQIHAGRFAEFGVSPERIRITGNTKFDAVRTDIPARERVQMRQQNGLPATAPLLIFGSTRPGDEALAARCWTGLRNAIPDLRLVVAPRHLDRIDEAIAAFEEPILRRSSVIAGRVPAGERILLLDVLGELAAFYSLAAVAVIGGSFYPGVNGHNPLEPAGLGVPAVFGPHMSNFAEPAQALLDAKGAIQLHSPESLPHVLHQLLSDPAEQRRVGTRARRAVLNGQGAVARNIDLIASVLEV